MYLYIKYLAELEIGSRSAYNYYVKEKLSERWKIARLSGVKLDTVQAFKVIADDWKNQEDMTNYNLKHISDEERFENEIEEFMEHGGISNHNENHRRVIYLENNMPNQNIFPFIKNTPAQNSNENHSHDEQMDPEAMPDGFYDLLPLSPDDKDSQKLEEEIKEEYRKNGLEYKVFKDDYSEIYADKES